MKISHRIRVQGRDISVKSSASPERVQEIESFVNARINEIESVMKGVDSQLAGILAMMNIAESYLNIREELEENRRQFTGRATRLVRMIEESTE